MITKENFYQVNFSVWCCDVGENSYTYQNHRGLGVEGTHAEKLKSNVLIINGDVQKVKDIDHALEIINKKRSKND